MRLEVVRDTYQQAMFGENRETRHMPCNQMLLISLALPVLSLALETLVIQTNERVESVHLGYEAKEHLFLPNGLLESLSQMDVVQVMKLTGHGEGLDEQRIIQVFGEDE